MPPTSSTLARLADTAIRDARRRDDEVAGTNEPSQVARLVRHLPQRLVENWGSAVQAGALTVSGAFLHFKPFVEWKDARFAGNPELADLLVIFERLDKGTRRALLVQAKKGTAEQFSLSGETEFIQRYMYSAWPEFSVKGTPKHVDVLPKYRIRPCLSPQDIGTRYAAFDEDKDAPVSWWCETNAASFAFSSLTPGTQTFPAPTTLGEVLEGMHDGLFGQPTGSGDDWSSLIEHLEELVAYHQALGPTKLPHVPTSAGVSPVLMSAATTFAQAGRRWPDFDILSLAYRSPHWAANWKAHYKAHWEVHGPGKQSTRPFFGSRSPLPPSGSGEIPSGFGVLRITTDMPLKRGD